jgi:pilus assembly protein Flp/PilA
MIRSSRAIAMAGACRVRAFIRGEDGPTSVEYAVMLATIVLVCVSAITLVGGETSDFWANNRTALETAFNKP